MRGVAAHQATVNDIIDVTATLCYMRGMKTDSIAFRPEPELRQALQRAAAAQMRSVSNLITLILTRALAKDGWLQQEDKPDARRQPR